MERQVIDDTSFPRSVLYVKCGPHRALAVSIPELGLTVQDVALQLLEEMTDADQRWRKENNKPYKHLI